MACAKESIYTLHFVAFLIILPLPSLAEEFTGKVVRVLDGDTIEVMHDGRPVRIRLHCIDCPEKGQPFGTVAKQFTSHMVFGKDLTVITHGTDRYGRTIGDVITADGHSLNEDLVHGGLAWWYRRYAPYNETLRQLEDEARRDKRGLWDDPAPVPPWEWRKLHAGSR